MSIASALGHQLKNPSGFAGRLVGPLMRIVNATPNRLAIDALNIQPYDHVLELGFGPGDAIALMTKRAPRGVIYGIDQSQVMLKQASTRNRDPIRAGRVALYRAAFDRLPFGEASIDKILAVNVIYFWHDFLAVTREIRRVLRPGGRLSIYATDADTMRHWAFADHETHRQFGISDLTGALQGAGFPAANTRITSVQLPGQIKGVIAAVDFYPSP